MKSFRQKRVWFWIAIAAIVIAVLALVVPHHNANGPDQFAWLALLPVFFVGLIAPFNLPTLLSVLSLGYPAKAPDLAPSFQRPPPNCA
jgi:bacteriorhodopsin